MSEHRVRVADLAVASGDVVISTVGLGSCVAISVHDRAARVGGLAHILLPSRELSRDTSNVAKFPETAVPALIAGIRAAGGRGPLTAKLAGGASMFAQLLPGGTNMGERNILACREALAANEVPIVAEDVGADYGRSVYLHVADGRVVIKSLKAGERVL